jgi:hypothetical protein
MVPLQGQPHRAFRVIQITKDAGLADTGGYTGRLLAFLDPVVAEGAFVGKPLVVVNVAGVIGAGSHTGLATHTAFLVQQYQAAQAAFVGGAGRAVVDTGRVVTVVAQLGAQFSAQIGKLSFSFLQHPCAKLLGRYVVLRLAGDNAGHAADAAPLIDYHCILRHIRPPLPVLQRYNAFRCRRRSDQPDSC